MKKKGQAAPVLLGGIIAVIIGVAMLPIFASLIDEAQVLQNEVEVNITNAGFNETFNLAHLKIVSSSFSISNASCGHFDGESTDCLAATGNQTMRDNTEFVLDERLGKLLFINRTGQWNVTYQFKPTTYIESSSGRVIIRQVTLMYAVALILITLAAVGINVMRKS